ncbi:MAG: GreA/GreB family elongation factor [Elusimicrobia bacterium]|nr:GreA/GreB family elongation factor [Elusimicrobiota bacterium]
MSQAFIKNDAEDGPPERRPPSGPNYVTPRGFELLSKKVRALGERRGELTKEERGELRYWQGRLSSAVPVDNSKRPPEDVRFGAEVVLKDAGGTRRVRIVGQDEADEALGALSWDSIAARVLTGHRPGESVTLEDGAAVEIVSVGYPPWT